MMKKGMALVLCAALLLCGCGVAPEDSPAGSYIWETMPQLIRGSLEYQKLEAEEWYCGRCEATGNCLWAETELGFYFLYDFTLFYADKADLSYWVPVCNQPECDHSREWSLGQPVCNAQVDANSFLMLDGRLYSETSSSSYPELKLGDGQCIVIFSRAADGTDRRREYYIPDTVSHGGGSSSFLLNYRYWLQCVNLLNTDGTYTMRFYCTTRDGDHLLAETVQEEMVHHTVLRWGNTGGGNSVMQAGPNGDATFFTTVFGDGGTVAYRFRDGQLEAPDIMDYSAHWRYLSGDSLRIFRAGDGLYDVDIRTGEETKVMDAGNRKNIAVVLPNCMLGYGTDGTRELFDGQQWREIQLPEELNGTMPSLACLASDRLLFTKSEERQVHIYQVLLDRQELVMEFCGTIQKISP